jgi:hypothetical protein
MINQIQSNKDIKETNNQKKRSFDRDMMILVVVDRVFLAFKMHFTPLWKNVKH